ncbi:MULTISPECIES: M48 family metallopeptidase [Deinococcus]|uniref:M48 family metallopeptidase n=1 Tax=Deinococcus rufus TaxID=2136097 RepID=A0ABV7ZAS4_9DEIO|nr:SprT family zinc-dependent metalloprotease [Deinococcus sp. AB2017081]WQE94660.1 SprT family zinc-dependent metalloprotease [Deinococcus sp. AB2017081]
MTRTTPLVAQYGTTPLAYSVERRPRTTLSIEVKADGSVLAVAPLDAPDGEIRRRVEKRGAWILRQQRELAVLPPPLPARRYVSGESWRYLGRQHRLRVVIGEVEGVRVTRGELLVTVRKQERTEAVVTRWFRERAQAILTERMQVCLERVAPFGIQHDGTFQLRRMTTRWGSCTRNGQIVFNPILIQAPTECIDYAIVHELCHIKEFNHSQKYYLFLKTVEPCWKKLRRKLNYSVELVDNST